MADAQGHTLPSYFTASSFLPLILSLHWNPRQPTSPPFWKPLHTWAPSPSPLPRTTSLPCPRPPVSPELSLLGDAPVLSRVQHRLCRQQTGFSIGLCHPAQLFLATAHPQPASHPMTPMLTRGGHDGELGPCVPQPEKPRLVASAGVEAGREDAQAHVAVLAQERSQCASTVLAGAPGDVTGDPVVQLLVQLPSRGPLQEELLGVAG